MVPRAAIRRALSNPWADEPALWIDALLELQERPPSAARFRELEEGERERWTLALELAAAVRAFPAPRLSKAHEALLPRSRVAYRRVASAAERTRRALTGLHGRSAAIRATRAAIWSACFGARLDHALTLESVIVDHDVLVLGETGTGKEVVAHAVQEASLGPDDEGAAPRAVVNAAAVPETLIEAELFGHERGAFTGAHAARRGRIRAADGGCFFLDEVGDLALTTQTKLLRVMETDEVVPVGADVAHPVAVRYVAATHRDLVSMCNEGKFRRDLYERLAGVVIEVPPLRERPEDVVDIGRALVQRYLGPGRGHVESERWLRRMSRGGHRWPGNARELHNGLRNVLLGLEPNLGPLEPRSPMEPSLPLDIDEGTASLEEVERWYVQRVVERHRGKHATAARTLGIHRSTVARKLAGD